jgi:protein gp37
MLSDQFEKVAICEMVSGAHVPDYAAGLAELAQHFDWPPSVWMGVTIENRRFVHRADALGKVPVVVRFISAEPLLVPLVGVSTSIDWLIAGREPGPGHRRVDIEWIRDFRDACNEADVAFFCKQWGGHRPKSNGRDLAQTVKEKALLCSAFREWRVPDSNRGHHDFQIRM